MTRSIRPGFSVFGASSVALLVAKSLTAVNAIWTERREVAQIEAEHSLRATNWSQDAVVLG